jgi:enoyl-CoA hydratase
LITHVAEQDRLEDDALAFARKLARGAPLAVRYTKASVNQLVKQSLTTALDLSMALELVTFVSSDHREALRALSAKEKPRFEGT